MSLIRIAARIAAVEALKGKTLVGDNVLDSEIGAIDVDSSGAMRTDEDRPFIAVYTDAANTEGATLRSLSVNGVTDFLFETGITAAMTERNEETGETTLLGVGIPATDAAFEFQTDMVVRQIGDALTDPNNEWSDIFRALAGKFVSIKRARTSGDSSGVRLAGQQLAIRSELFNEPVQGAPLAATHPLARFFTKAAELDSPVVTTQVTLMQAQLAGNATDFKIMQQRFGRTGAEAAASGLEVVGSPITTPELPEAP
jgi:hypothetical protein